MLPDITVYLLGGTIEVTAKLRLPVGDTRTVGRQRYLTAFRQAFDEPARALRDVVRHRELYEQHTEILAAIEGLESDLKLLDLEAELQRLRTERPASGGKALSGERLAQALAAWEKNKQELTTRLEDTRRGGALLKEKLDAAETAGRAALASLAEAVSGKICAKNREGEDALQKGLQATIEPSLRELAENLVYREAFCDQHGHAFAISAALQGDA